MCMWQAVSDYQEIWAVCLWARWQVFPVSQPQPVCGDSGKPQLTALLLHYQGHTEAVTPDQHTTTTTNWATPILQLITRKATTTLHTPITCTYYRVQSHTHTNQKLTGVYKGGLAACRSHACPRHWSWSWYSWRVRARGWESGCRCSRHWVLARSSVMMVGVRVVWGRVAESIRCSHCRTKGTAMDKLVRREGV